MRFSVTYFMLSLGVLGFASAYCLAQQHITVHDCNVDDRSYCQYDLPSSQSSFPCGTDLWVNVTVENRNDYWVVLLWRVRWYRPDGSSTCFYEETEGTSIAANCYGSGCFNCYSYYCTNYRVCPGTWQVRLEVKEFPQNGPSTSWQTVCDDEVYVEDCEPEVTSLAPSNSSPCPGDTIELCAHVSEAAQYTGTWTDHGAGGQFSPPSVSVNDDCVEERDHCTNYTVPESPGQSIQITFTASNTIGSDHRNTNISVKNEYVLTVGQEVPYGAGTVEVSPTPGPYCAGTSVCLTAHANAGECWVFDHWDINGDTSHTEPYICITMNGNTTATPYFRRMECYLDVSSTDGGTVLTPGEGGAIGPYECQIPVVIIAQADAHYHFTGWTGSCVDGGMVADPSSQNTVLTAVCSTDGGSCTLVANFSINQCYAAVSSTDGGSVACPGDGSTFGPYAWGTSVPIEAQAEECYSFAGWVGSCVDAGLVADPSLAETTLTAGCAMHNGECSLQATFERDTCELSMAVSPDGAGITDPAGETDVGCCEAVTIEAIGAASYGFDYWAAVPVEHAAFTDISSEQTSVTLTGDATVTAFFTCVAQTRLQLLPAPQEVRFLDTFQVQVAIQDVNDLYGFELDVAFDATKLRAVTVTEGEFLSNSGADPTYWQAPEIDNTGGTVQDIVCARLTPGLSVSGSGLLAVIEFEEIMGGPTPYATTIAYVEEEAKLSDPAAHRLCVGGFDDCPISVGPCFTNEECDDENECTEDVCDPDDPAADPATGCVYTNVADQTPCTDDGYSCTDDVCMGGSCTHVPDNGACDDENECTEDVCDPDDPAADPATGCVYTNVADQTPCTNDGYSCTDDVCMGGSCTHIPENGACDDGDECTEDVCDPSNPAADPATGCVFTAITCDYDGICEPPCETSANCPEDCGPDADFVYRCVFLAEPSTLDQATTLPEGLTEVSLGQTFYAEFWATDSGDLNTGITCAYADLDYPEDMVSCVPPPVVAPLFSLFPTGECNGLVVDELGGCQLSGGVGMEPDWARVGYVGLTCDALGSAEFILEPAASESSAHNRGLIPTSSIDYGSCTIDCLGCRCIYDLDNNCNVAGGDLGFFAGCWLCCDSDACWEENSCEEKDFDCNGCVAGGDLGWFAGAWLRTCDELDPIADYPDCRQCDGPIVCPWPSGPGRVSGMTAKTAERRKDADGSVKLALRLTTHEAQASQLGRLSHATPRVVKAGDHLYAEVWVREDSATGPGLTAVFADLEYNPSQFEVVGVEPGEIFTLFAAPSIAGGIVRRVGGATMDAGIGADAWVLVSVVELKALTHVTEPSMTLRPAAQEAVSRRGHGLVRDELIEIVTDDGTVEDASKMKRVLRGQR